MSAASQTSERRHNEMPAMRNKLEAQVVQSFPYWVEPPQPGQDLNDIEWGVMEVLSDKSLRFVKTDPDPVELQALIESLENHSKKSPV